MNLRQFERQVGALQAQVAALWPSTRRQQGALPPAIVDSFAALTLALAELQAADVEIRQQSAELAWQQDILEAARLHWHDLFDLAPDGYLVTDLNGIVTEANQSAVQLFAVAHAELVGAPLTALVMPEARRVLLAKLRRPPREGQKQEFDLRLKPHGAPPVLANVTVARIAGLDPRQELQLVWLLRDVTDRREYEVSLRRAHDDLEARVRERTADLEASRGQAQALARRLVEIQETERQAIARELHDEAGQALSAMLLGLSAIQKEADSPEVAARAAELHQLADSTMEGLHRLAMRLRPISLDRVGLAGALQQHVATFGQQNALDAQLMLMGLEAERLPGEVEVTVYRVVQEALTNVARHAQAQHVDVIVQRDGERVRAIIEDDGLGFDVEAALACGRLGLLGMRERLEMLGGSLAIESAAGKGTTVFAEVPCAGLSAGEG